jgi:cytochrome b
MTETSEQLKDAPKPSPRLVPVWDLPTRLFHWVQALLFVALWITGTDGPLDWHMWLGEALLAMLLFRVIWGFVGSRHSRFADFVAGRQTARKHFLEMVRIARSGPLASEQAEPHVGHTPLGGWMIVCLLFLMTLQCVTGLFSSDEIVTDGPLNHLVDGRTGRVLSVIHSMAFDVIMALVIAHIAAAFFYLLRKRENLIRPLITGRANLPEAVARRETPLASVWLAILIFAIAIALVRALISV